MRLSRSNDLSHEFDSLSRLAGAFFCLFFKLIFFLFLSFNTGLFENLSSLYDSFCFPWYYPILMTRLNKLNRVNFFQFHPLIQS